VARIGPISEDAGTDHADVVATAVGPIGAVGKDVCCLYGGDAIFYVAHAFFSCFW